MDFQSIFGWKSLPEAGFGKNVVIEADRCSGSRIHLNHPNAGRSVVQDHSSDHRFKRLHLTRASVRRARGFVLTGYSETMLLKLALMIIFLVGPLPLWRLIVGHRRTTYSSLQLLGNCWHQRSSLRGTVPIRRIEAAESLPHSGIRFPQNPYTGCPYIGLSGGSRT